jgi:hypothetical protein
MAGLSPTVAAPLFVLLLVLAMDAWVYADAAYQAQRGTPVVFSTGTFRVETPAAWLLGTLVLGIVFLPLYLVTRNGPRPSR